VIDQLIEPVIDLHLDDLAGAVVVNPGVSPVTLILPLIAALAISMVAYRHGAPCAQAR
jgi:hypothetical protein